MSSPPMCTVGWPGWGWSRVNTLYSAYSSTAARICSACTSKFDSRVKAHNFSCISSPGRAEYDCGPSSAAQCTELMQAGLCRASQCLHCKIFIGQMSGQRGTISASLPRISCNPTQQGYAGKLAGRRLCFCIKHSGIRCMPFPQQPRHCG